MLYFKKLRLLFLCAIFVQQGFGQISQGLLDSLSGHVDLKKGITVYPIQFNNVTIPEWQLVELNHCHYNAIKGSGIWKPDIGISKKRVKRNDLDVGLGDIIKHSPQPYISVVNINMLEMEGTSGHTAPNTYQITTNLVATHTIYNVVTGEKVYTKVIHSLVNLNHQSEVCSLFENEIKNGILAAFPIYTKVVTIDKNEKNKANYVSVSSEYSEVTGKKDLFVNKITGSYTYNGKTYYQVKTIARTNFKQKYNATLMLYGLVWGGKEVGEFDAKNSPLFVSTIEFK